MEKLIFKLRRATGMIIVEDGGTLYFRNSDNKDIGTCAIQEGKIIKVTGCCLESNEILSLLYRLIEGAPTFGRCYAFHRGGGDK